MQVIYLGFHLHFNFLTTHTGNFNIHHSRGHFKLVPSVSFTVGNKKWQNGQDRLKDFNWPIHHPFNENKSVKLAL